MSEGTIPIKKAVRIIVVTWILSLITTLALVYVVLSFAKVTNIQLASGAIPFASILAKLGR